MQTFWWLLSDHSLTLHLQGPVGYMWGRHQRETFSVLLALCAGNSPVAGELPSQRPVSGTLMFSLICAWITGWVNKREAGDLRRHRVHYDVTVMICDKSMKCDMRGPILWMWDRNPKDISITIYFMCNWSRSHKVVCKFKSRKSISTDFRLKCNIWEYTWPLCKMAGDPSLWWCTMTTTQWSLTRWRALSNVYSLMRLF